MVKTVSLGVVVWMTICPSWARAGSDVDEMRRDTVASTGKPLDMKAKVLGVRFKKNDPNPRYAISVSGQSLYGTLTKDFAGQEDSHIERAKQDRLKWLDIQRRTHQYTIDEIRAQDERELAAEASEKALRDDRVKDANKEIKLQLLDPRNWYIETASKDDKSVLKSLFIDAVSLEEDGSLNVYMLPYKDRSFRRIRQVRLKADFHISFLYEDKVHGKKTVYTQGDASNSEFEAKAKRIRYAEWLTFSASTSSASNQELLLLKRQTTADKENVQRFDLKGTLQGEGSLLRSLFSKMPGYDELKLAVVGSSERRDPKSKIEITSSSIESPFVPRIHGFLPVSDFVVSSTQALPQIQVVERMGYRWSYGLAPKTASIQFHTHPSEGKNAALIEQTDSATNDLKLGSLFNGDQSAAKAHSFYSLDEMLGSGGFLQPEIEGGGSFRSNSDLKEPERNESILRFRLRFQTPRFSLGSDRFYMNATATAYALPFKRYSGSNDDRTWNASFEIASYFRFNDHTALKVAFGGGGMPESRFQWVRPVFSFGIASGF